MNKLKHLTLYWLKRIPFRLRQVLKYRIRRAWHTTSRLELIKPSLCHCETHAETWIPVRWRKDAKRKFI